MAPGRKKAKSAAGNNPSTALVVFLVFFILLSLGLGVWGYYGYKRADEKEKKGQDLAKSEAAAKLGQEWYQLQALWTKGVLGYDLQPKESNDLATLLSDLSGPKFNGEAGKPAVQKMIEDDKKELALLPDGKWDPRAKRFPNTYREAYQRMKAERDKLLKDKKDLEAKVAAAERREDKRDGDNKTAWTSLKDDVAKVNNNALKAAKDADARVQKAQGDLLKANEDAATKLKQAQEEYALAQKKLTQTLKEKDEEIARLAVFKRRLEAAEDEKAKAATTDLLKYETPKGRIVRVDWTGKMPYVDLGKADGVKEQLTFSIFGKSPNGQIDKEPKGSLEIIKVIDAHLSQARLSSLRDPYGNPLQEGDLIYNPAWSPGRRTHVALAGIVNLAGEEGLTLAEEQRNLMDFIRRLEAQNIVVDAYLDLRTRQAKGPGMTLKTDYFILCDGPSYTSTFLLTDKEKARMDVKTEINQKMEEMRKEAVKKGVTLIPLHKFAVMSGFRMPRLARNPDASYRPTANGDAKEPKKAKKGEGEDEKPDVEKKDKEEKGGQKLGEEKKEMKKKDKDEEKE